MKVRELLSSPDKWVKTKWAADLLKRPVDPCSPDAVCFCLLGAIDFCYREGTDVKDEVRNKIRKYIGRASIMLWNDAPERTFEEVKSLVNQLDI